MRGHCNDDEDMRVSQQHLVLRPFGSNDEWPSLPVRGDAQTFEKVLEEFTDLTCDVSKWDLSRLRQLYTPCQSTWPTLFDGERTYESSSSLDHQM